MVAGPRHQAGEPSLRASTMTIIRLLIGWSCTGLGLLDLAMGLEFRYTLFHLVMLVAGVLLVGLGMLRKPPDRTAYLAGALVTVAGMVTGFPFPAKPVPDLFFWACIGFFVLLVITVVRPDRRPSRAQRHGPLKRHAHVRR